MFKCTIAISNSNSVAYFGCELRLEWTWSSNRNISVLMNYGFQEKTL